MSQGHLWYDPHGSVLTSTLPVTLTQQLFSSQGLDSRLGLVYHGDGRYYDPAIAHSLQPDPVGGVPHLPQTLNRYSPAAGDWAGVRTSSGRSIPPLVRSSLNQLPALTISLSGVLEQVSGRLAAKSYMRVATGWTLVEVAGPARSVAFLSEEGFEIVSSRPASGLLGQIASRLDPGRRILTLRGYARSEALAAGETVALGRGVMMRPLAQEMTQVVDDAATQAAARRLADVLGIGVSGVVGGLVQYAYDYDNPYLTDPQKAQRAFVSGSLSAVAAGIGVGVGYLACPPLGLTVSIILVIGADAWLAPVIFEGIGAVEQRRLAPLPP